MIQLENDAFCIPFKNPGKWFRLKLGLEDFPSEYTVKKLTERIEVVKKSFYKLNFVSFFLQRFVVAESATWITFFVELKVSFVLLIFSADFYNTNGKSFFRSVPFLMVTCKLQDSGKLMNDFQL